MMIEIALFHHPFVCEKSFVFRSSLETAIANDVLHLELQSDGTGALLVAEESGQEDGMNLSVRRRESVATSGYLSADEEGKLQSRIIKASYVV